MMYRERKEEFPAFVASMRSSSLLAEYEIDDAFPFMSVSTSSWRLAMLPACHAAMLYGRGWDSLRFVR